MFCENILWEILFFILPVNYCPLLHRDQYWCLNMQQVSTVSQAIWCFHFHFAIFQLTYNIKKGRLRRKPETPGRKQQRKEDAIPIIAKFPVFEAFTGLL